MSIDHETVGEYLVACAKFEKVVHHHELSANFYYLAISPDSSEWLVNNGEAVESAFCRELLDNPDEQIEHESPPEQRVLPIADNQDKHEARANNAVEQIEEVSTKNVDE